MSRTLSATVRAALAFGSGAVLLAASSCAQEPICAATAYGSVLEVTVVGDDSAVASVTACPIEDRECAPWSKLMASNNQDGVWLADLGTEAYDTPRYTPTVVELRAYDRTGKVLATSLAGLERAEDNPGAYCGTPIRAKATLTLSGS